MMAQAAERLPKAPRLAYVCGSNPFVSAAADALIGAGVPAEIIRTERYGV
jgi:ferredoxin-NADP reductase